MIRQRDNHFHGTLRDEFQEVQFHIYVADNSTLNRLQKVLRCHRLFQWWNPSISVNGH